MRGILLTLVFLNILYFGWKFTHQDHADEAVSKSILGNQKVPQLVLLSEKRGSKRNKSETKAAPISLCPEIGPFDDRPSALLFATELQIAGIVTRLKSKNDINDLKYWVYLPIGGGKEAAMLKLNELREKQIESYLITKGELKGQVSLGVFNNLESANGLQSKLEALGIDTRLHKKSKRTKLFWLSIEADNLNDEQEQALKDALDKQSEIKVVQSAC